MNYIHELEIKIKQMKIKEDIILSSTELNALVEYYIETSEKWLQIKTPLRDGTLWRDLDGKWHLTKDQSCYSS
jgi:hypothetical protein